jgi:TonB family protein
VDAAVLPAGILEKIDLRSPAPTVALAVGTLENGRLFAYRCLVNDLAFAQPSTSGLPRHSRLTYGIAAVVHILVFALLIHVTTQPRRVSSAGSPSGSMTAYVAGPIAAGQAVAPAKPVEPKKTALATRTATAVPKDDQAGAGTSAGSAGVAGGQAGTGPVRLGTDGNLTLIKKVTPIYPTLMQSARMTGQVVLDAIIHPDGTIGDIRVLRSTNDAFAQSAIAAVKQWRYTAPGFEGILTVSVNFTLAA